MVLSKFSPDGCNNPSPLQRGEVSEAGFETVLEDLAGAALCGASELQ